MDGISRRELARRHDISESTVRRHVDSGALADALLADGSLDSRKASDALRRVLSTGKVVPRDLADARVRRLRALVRKAGDELQALRKACIPPRAAASLIAAEMAIVTTPIRRLPEMAKGLAGRPAAEVQRALRGLAIDALTVITSADAPEHDWWNDPPDPPMVDIDALSPNALSARRIDLAAQKLEIAHAREHGDILDTDEVLDAFGLKLSTLKAGLLVLPGRVAQLVSAADEDGAERLVAAEVQELLGEWLDEPT